VKEKKPNDSLAGCKDCEHDSPKMLQQCQIDMLLKRKACPGYKKKVKKK